MRPILQITASLLIGLCQAASAQGPSDTSQQSDILDVVYAWAETLSTGDLERRKALTIDGSMIQRLRQQEDGSYTMTPSISKFADMRPSNSVMVERFWDEEIIVRGQFASFVASYDFWIDGEFSHCGIDVFDLIQMDGQWKIGNMKFTIQRQGCPPSPLGDLN